MDKIILFILGIIIFNNQNFAQKTGKNIGGIGGQAVFDSTAQRFKIKSLEINHYLNSKTLNPGDLILEVDKVPIQKMGYGNLLSLVQGVVGTQMSLKILRYNAIVKYYEIKRIRVTLDMNPIWWSVPDYKYYNLIDGINYAISELELNVINSVDSTMIPKTKNSVYCNFNIRGAYESIYINNINHYYYNCSFIKTDDKLKADSIYNYLINQLVNYNIRNLQLIKTENILSDVKIYKIQAKEILNSSLANLNIDVQLKKEFDKDEKKHLWKVELIVKV